MVPAVEDELRVAMADEEMLGVHFSVTASTLQGKHRESGTVRPQRRADVSQAVDSPDPPAPASTLSTRLRYPFAKLKLHLVSNRLQT